MKSCIKVVSLETSSSRREAFSQNNSHIHFEFFNAIDGRELPREIIENPAFFEPGLPYTPGAYGCALSHVILWNEAIRLNETLTIVEDDAIFRLDFEEQFSRLVGTLSPEWDMIIWGWNFDTILALNIMPDISPAVVLFDQDQMRRSIVNFQNSKENLNLLKLDQCFGIPAYSISPNGAKKFRSLCFPLTNFRLSFPVLGKELSNQGIDVAMSRIYKLTNTFCCFPPLAITKNDHAISAILKTKRDWNERRLPGRAGQEPDGRLARHSNRTGKKSPRGIPAFPGGGRIRHHALARVWHRDGVVLVRDVKARMVGRVDFCDQVRRGIGAANHRNRRDHRQHKYDAFHGGISSRFCL